MGDSQPLSGLIASLVIGGFGLAGLWFSQLYNTPYSTLEIVCVSLGLPTAILYIIYLTVAERSIGQYKATKKVVVAQKIDGNAELSKQQHLQMMLSDPLLRDPIMYLERRGSYSDVTDSDEDACGLDCVDSTQDQDAKIDLEPHHSQLMETRSTTSMDESTV